MTACPEVDVAVGMDVYGSDGEPCPARAKSSEGDFKVEELMTHPEISGEDKPGYLPVYMVEKHSVDTMHVQRELEVVLKSRVSYGGLKDKRAAAVQYMTPTSSRSERPESIVGDRFTAKLVGFAPRPLSRESVGGNRFEVVLRDCCEHVGKRAGEVFGLLASGKVPNFYGHQRFGAREAATHLLGRAIVNRRFREAVELMLVQKRGGDDEQTQTAREAMSEGRYEESWRLLPPQQDVEKRVARALSRDPGNWVSALRAVPTELRRLYTQAYQSYIFNRTLSIAMRRGLDISRFEGGDNWSRLAEDGLVVSPAHGVREPATPDAIPMVQFAGYAYRNYGSRFDSCVEEVMDEEGVEARDFYVREMQEVSVEGGFRVPHMVGSETSCDYGDATARLKFVLSRGQYATVLLREIVKPSDPLGCGLA